MAQALDYAALQRSLAASVRLKQMHRRCSCEPEAVGVHGESMLHGERTIRVRLGSTVVGYAMELRMSRDAPVPGSSGALRDLRWRRNSAGTEEKLCGVSHLCSRGADRLGGPASAFDERPMPPYATRCNAYRVKSLQSMML